MINIYLQDDAKHEYYDTETCSYLVTMITSISIITVAHCSITSLLTIALDIQVAPLKFGQLLKHHFSQPSLGVILQSWRVLKTRDKEVFKNVLGYPDWWKIDWVIWEIKKMFPFFSTQPSIQDVSPEKWSQRNIS